MDIKWRNFPNWFYSKALKCLAGILAAVCAGVALLMLTYLDTHISYFNVAQESYRASNFRAEEMGTLSQSVARLLTQYKSEDFVRSGGTVDMEDLQRELYDEYYSTYYDRYIVSDGGERTESPETARRNGEELRRMLQEQVIADHAAELEEKKQKRIVEELQEYYRLIEELNRYEGVYYYASDGEVTLSNVSGATKEFFLQQPVYLLFDNGKYEKDDELTFHSELHNVTPNDKVYVAFSAEELARREAAFQQDRVYLGQVILYLVLLFAIGAVSILYLMFATGRSAHDEAIHLCPVDRIYTDLLVLLLILACVLLGGAYIGLFDYMDGYQTRYVQEAANTIVTNEIMREPVVFYSLAASLFAGVAAIEVLFLSFVRQLKAKQLVSHSLIGAGARKVWRLIQWLLSKGPLLIVSTQQIDTVRDGVKKVKEGDLEHRISLPKGKALYKLSEDINTVTEGLQKAVEKELKAERLKTELITNVSHDLKTPLTSIINYSDLLTKEKLTPDYANDYAKVIYDKSEKLKQLTNDLFEISKVQSGNIEVNLERLQVKTLILQCLAEYEQRFLETGLDVRLSPVPDDLYIRADGKKMARVLENLVVNILKYAQPQTRVYVDVLQKDGKCAVIFKNMANYEMNFLEDEIVQRFARGDESRTGDGNGLGLAIAQSYVEACGGTFRVKVDGDLFKATVLFDISEGS